ncbi:MAG: hypothetical protein ACYC7E_14450 [Armatimonadota bacterium]
MKIITGFLLGCLLLITTLAYGAPAKSVRATVAFGARKHAVVITDSNANGRIGDSMRPLRSEAGIWAIVPGDTVDISDGKIKTAYGQPVDVDGAWYALTQDAKGAVTAKALKIELGKVQIDNAGWEGIFVGKRYILLLNGTRKEAVLPADDYTLVSLRPRGAAEYRPLENPTYSNLAAPLAVVPGKVAQVMLHPTVTASMTSTAAADGQLRFTVKFQTTDPCADEGDAWMAAFVEQKLRLEILNAQGKIIHQAALAMAAKEVPSTQTSYG